MSTHKKINIICVVAIIFALVLTVVVMNFSNFGVENANKVMEYENKIFDTSKVHEINIEMDDWDGFIETCENEEYTACNVEIDDEVFNNVGIRAKGNTSLSNVSSMDSERYSFKLEFDQYNFGESYYGLDKLSLNNLIQDNTYMKDYLTYRMMNEFDVDSSLCSFVYITVNGEDWGLYLAVEGVEDSFLERNYGKDYGELYKPDSMEFGGGRGNGKDFNMDDFNKENSEDNGDSESNSQSDKINNENVASDDSESNNQDSNANEKTGTQGIDGNSDNMPSQWNAPDNGSTPQNGNMPSDGNVPPGGAPPQGGNVPPGGNPPQGGNTTVQGSPMNQSAEGTGENTPPQNTGKNQPAEGFEPPDFSQNGDKNSGQSSSQSNSTQDSQNSQQNEQNNGNSEEKSNANGFNNPPEMPGFGNGEKGGGGFGSMNSSATLKYIDDETSSYSTIFDSAKTDVSKTDKKRLISSLKALSEGENLDSVLDIEKLMRYFVVHNYVVNGDSYTGSMIHNYYLYEKNGQLSMIPWDYNLAFGCFQGNNANDAVNDPIDTPLNVSGDGSKPMIDWIFSSEEYTELYHQYLSEFLSEIDIQSMIQETYELIKPYVEKDPTAFCTYEEFEKGVTTLKSFCQLRSESVSAQLEGTIPSTDEGQKADSSNLIDASSITISDMGTMGMGGGKMPDFNGGDMPEFNSDEIPEFNAEDMPNFDGQEKPNFNGQNSDNQEINDSKDTTGSVNQEVNEDSSSVDNNVEANDNLSDKSAEKTENSDSQDNKTNKKSGNSFDGKTPPNGNMQNMSKTGSIFSKNNLILLGVSLAILIAGLVIAIRYRRR